MGTFAECRIYENGKIIADEKNIQHGLTNIEKMVKFDETCETYIGALAALITSIITLFGISITKITQIPLIFKFVIILYLSLNATMCVLATIELYRLTNRQI